MNRLILLDSIKLAIPILIIYLIFKSIRKNFKSLDEELMNILMLFYLTSFCYLLWFQPCPVYDQQPYNFVVFSTIDLYYNQLINGFMPIKLIIINLMGNVIITGPIGIWLSYKRVNRIKALILALFIPIVIELGQYILHLLNYATRVVDIDDWLLNALGILLGYWLTEIIVKRTIKKIGH